MTCSSVVNLSDLYLHFVLIFTFLSLLFIFYFSRVVEKSVNNAIGTQLTGDNLKNLINGNPALKAYLITLDDDGVLNKFSDSIPSSDLDKTYINSTVIKFVYTLVLFVILTFLIFYISKIVVGCQGFILPLFISAIISIFLLGIVELVFFTFIAQQYIPTDNRELYNYMLSAIKSM